MNTESLETTADPTLATSAARKPPGLVLGGLRKDYGPATG
jgi:hypothetical protein